MTMIGLTIATGRYLPYGLQAATSMARQTGLRCDVLTDVPPGRPPSFHRLWIWDLVPADVDAVVYFDADTYCVAPWKPQDYASTGQFWACKDQPTPRLGKECKRFAIDRGRYFNAGVFIASRQHQDAFRLAQQIATAPDYQSRYLEQTAFNAAVQRSAIPVGRLSPQHNVYCNAAAAKTPDPIILHVCGGGMQPGHVRVFEQLKRQCLHRS